MTNAPSNSAHTMSPVIAVTPPPTTHVEPKQPSEYERYLQSPRWRTLARAVRMRAKGKCQICRRADGEEVAHLTYERIFHEPIDDLLWVCKKCHRELDRNQQS